MSELRVSLEYAKFTPGPTGQSKYPDNQGGFDLVGSADVGTTNQGSGSGPAVYPIHLQVKGTKVDWSEFRKRVATNDKKPTRLVLTSKYLLSGNRESMEESTYEGIEFKNVLPNFSQGEQKGVIFLDMTYTKVTSQLKAFGPDGKALPSSKSMTDLEKGSFE